jgi:hypothetical protein
MLGCPYAFKLQGFRRRAGYARNKLKNSALSSVSEVVAAVLAGDLIDLVKDQAMWKVKLKTRARIGRSDRERHDHGSLDSLLPLASISVYSC